LKPCNDLIVHRRRDGFSQTRSSPSVWRQFRSPPSRSHKLGSRELTQRMRASIMRLRRPIFLPSITDRKRRCGHPCCLHHRKSTHEAAEASQTSSIHVRTRPEPPRAKISRCTTRSGRVRGGCSSSASWRAAAAAAGPAGAAAVAVGGEERRAGAGSSNWVRWARG
jgi:hypothetical protein